VISWSYDILSSAQEHFEQQNTLFHG